MSRYLTCLTLGLVLGMAGAARGQFSFGIGIGSGGGGSFYYGRGGGYYGPGFYGPGYYGLGYGPGYRGGVGIRVGNLGYYDYGGGSYRGRGYYYAQPRVGYTYILPNNSVAAPRRVLPDNKIAPTKLTLQEGDILLRSPQDAPGDVGYGINDQWVYTIQPGQKQKLAAGRQWTIEFQRGIDGAEPARYTLDPGVYEFHFAENSGWELERVGDAVLPPPHASESDPSAAKIDAAEDVPLPAEPPPEG